MFVGTLAELTAKTGGRYVIRIETGQGEQHYMADNIGDTLLALLQDYKSRGIAVSDIHIDRGTLEQHFMDLAMGNGKGEMS